MDQFYVPSGDRKAPGNPVARHRNAPSKSSLGLSLDGVSQLPLADQVRIAVEGRAQLLAQRARIGPEVKGKNKFVFCISPLECVVRNSAR